MDEVVVYELDCQVGGGKVGRVAEVGDVVTGLEVKFWLWERVEMGDIPG